MLLLPGEEVLEDLENSEVITGQLVDGDMLRSSVNSGRKLVNILHINIRSIRHNIDKLVALLDAYDLAYNDIVVLSETFQLSAKELDACSVPGYDTLYNFGDYNRNDGVILLVKSNIDREFSYNKLTNSKVTVSRMTCQIDNVSIGITAVYRPPPVSKLFFIQDVDSYLASISRNHIEVFIGDTNINILDSEDDDTTHYLSMLAQLGFVSYVNTVTRFDSRTCLDHIFVSNKLKANKLDFHSYVLDHHMTDHGPVMLNVGYEHMRRDKCSGSHYIEQVKTNIYRVKQKLRLQDWSVITGNSDPETATKKFVSIYREIINTSKVTSMIKTQKKNKKWITNGLITSIKHRDKLKRKLLKNYSVKLENEYKVYRNYLNKLIRQQKNDYYRQQINRNTHDIKKIYRLIRDANYESINKTAVRVGDESGRQFLDDVEMANYCNDYFINVGLKLERSIPEPRNSSRLGAPQTASMFLTPVTASDLINSISSLKNNTSPGYDGVTAEIVKYTHLEIVEPLQHIINQSFKTGIVPSDFKISLVTPIYKNGSKTNIENYRPISIISIFARIFEKCLKQKLVGYLEFYDVLSHNQFGFVGGRSTTDALYKFTSEVTYNLNNGNKCLGVFIDLARAFDTIPHDKLLLVLSHLGVRGVVLELMTDYLRDRKQVVRINGSLSGLQTVKIGVPQGTVLGPILFVTYLNSLLTQDIGGTIVSYADDTALIFSGKDWEETKHRMTNGLQTVRDWLETNKLSMNVTKTNYIAFSLTAANRPHFNSISVGDSQINEVPHTRYLGIVIDQFLKWKPHIDSLSKKIRMLIHKFYVIREFLNAKILIMVYRSLVESLITYGIVVWGGLYNNALYKLNVVQKYILKIIYKKNRIYPSSFLFTRETLNIRSLYMLQICTYIHARPVMRRLIDHGYNTRAKNNRDVQIPINYKNINLRYVDYLAPKVYNMLPRHVRGVTYMRGFRGACKIFIFENYSRMSEIFK